MLNCTKEIFTTPIYCRDKINPPFKDKLKLIPIFSELVKNPASNEESGTMFYGVEGNTTLHETKQLEWLNKQVKINTKIYLNDLGIDTNYTKFNIEEALPSICYNKGGKVNYHKNIKSHLTAFYCFRGDDNDSGKITLYRDNKFTQNVSYDFEDQNSKYLSSIALKTHISFFPGRLIIIPINTDYEILPYFGKKHRFFIKYSLTIFS